MIVDKFNLEFNLVKFPILFPIIYGLILYSLPQYETVLIFITILLLAETHFGATWPFFLNKSNSDLIEKNLLGGADNIDPKNDYHFCVATDSASKYIIYAEQISGTCKLELDGLNRWCESQGTGKCSC